MKLEKTEPEQDAPAPVTLTQVLDLVVTEGDDEGTLDIAWDPVYGATGYEIHTSPDPITANSWTLKKSASKSSDTLPSLLSGSKMWVRVRAVGSGNKTGPYSDPGTKIVP